MIKRAASRLVKGGFDAELVRQTATELRGELSGPATFALVFATPDYCENAAEFSELIRVYGRVPTLIGCTGAGIAGSGFEQEEGSGFSLVLLSIPGAPATSLPCAMAELEEAPEPGDWLARYPLGEAPVKAWLVYLNPFAINHESWLKLLNTAHPGVPIFGGLAGGFPADREATIFCNDQVGVGGVALALQGEVEVRAVVSQGCKPIGEPLTITDTDRHVLLTLGSRPAYEVLNDVYQDLTETEREQAGGHLFAGLAMTEYVDEYKRGDFLVRNIIGADPKSGAVAINALPRVGQTLQYQLRDSTVATEELRRLVQIEALRPGPPPFAALLCTCIGRGKGLFRRAHHDAGLIDEFFPGLPLAGFFSNGEIGPVGPRSFAHSYTASVALLAPTRRVGNV